MFKWILAVVVAGILLLTSQSLTFAADYRCSSNSAIRIVAADEVHVALVCSATRDALAFLKQYGLTPKREIKVEIVSETINGHGASAYGLYDVRLDTIRLMSIGAIMAHGTEPKMHDEPLNSEQYRGAVAHEVAHAVVQHHLTETPLSAAAHEYLAYATQLAVLSDISRQRIISRTAVGAWLPGDAISDVYMALKPTYFAVKSYLHLTSSEESVEFVQILLNSKWFYVYVPG